MHKKTPHPHKESPPLPRKSKVRVILSRGRRRADQQADIERSIDALLAELVRKLDQRGEQPMGREGGYADGID